MNGLKGKRVVLRAATMRHRRSVYEWMAKSDVTPSMMGRPHYPEKPIPRWKTFCNDYVAHYFNGSAPSKGRCFIIYADREEVGQINYNNIFEVNGLRKTELDMWMRESRYCGHGFGTDALLTLCLYLRRRFQVDEVMVQPSSRNKRAIRAYLKAGFDPVRMSRVRVRKVWGGSDYRDGKVMVKKLSDNRAA